MSLDEYKRKRRFEATPEPPPKLEKKSRHRFVVQKHRASRLHYDFRLEMEGVLKSWAVPKGPSLDPSDKRLAMQVEDHPVSYFDFEGTIPEGNYGAGAVMVWDVGTWEPLSPATVNGKYVAGSDAEASAMLQKGDLKIRLHGKRLKGDFALIHMKGRRPGSKGTEWLLIKKHDDNVIEGYDIDKYDSSALSKRSMAQIAGDEESAQWKSSRPAAKKSGKAAWLDETLAKLDKAKKKSSNAPAPATNGNQQKGKIVKAAGTSAVSVQAGRGNKNSAVSSPSSVSSLQGAVKRPMLTAIHPMLATSIEAPFDDPDWLFEIKWDGYRAVAFIEKRKVRLVSRNQNEMTAQFSELQDIAGALKAETAVVDGEIVAVDEQGRSSFSLMQQRTGFRAHGRRVAAQGELRILYYIFDLLYLDGYDLRRVSLIDRKQVLQGIFTPNAVTHFSDHFRGQGLALFEAAKQQGLEGILAKRASSCYEERRTREWFKIKITQTVDCVVGGYIDPEGSREYFGSLVLGLYDQQKRLIHVGQAGTGFDRKMLKSVWQRLQTLQTKEKPFYGSVDAGKPKWVKPKLVAEIKFAEWTHETADGGLKLRAPVFLRLRDDKDPEDCTLEQQVGSLSASGH